MLRYTSIEIYGLMDFFLRLDCLYGIHSNVFCEINCNIYIYLCNTYLHVNIIYCIKIFTEKNNAGWLLGTLRLSSLIWTGSSQILILSSIDPCQWFKVLRLHPNGNLLHENFFIDLQGIPQRLKLDVRDIKCCIQSTSGGWMCHDWACVFVVRWNRLII